MDSLAGVPRLSDLRYAELHVGQRFGPFREELAAAVSDELRGELGRTTAGDHAPGGVLPLVTLRVLRRALGGIPPGGVLLGQRFAGHAELPAACALDVDVRVARQDERDGHLDTTFVFRVAHDGDLAAVVDWTIRAA